MVTFINQLQNESVQAARHIMVLLRGGRIFDLWLIMQGFQQVATRTLARFLSSDVAIDGFVRAEFVDCPGEGIQPLMPSQMERLAKWPNSSMNLGFAGWTIRVVIKTTFSLASIHCFKDSFVRRSEKCAIFTCL